MLSKPYCAPSSSALVSLLLFAPPFSAPLFYSSSSLLRLSPLLSSALSPLQLLCSSAQATTWPFLQCPKRAGASLCACLYTRLKMGLPFHNRLAYNLVHRRNSFSTLLSLPLLSILLPSVPATSAPLPSAALLLNLTALPVGRLEWSERQAPATTRMLKAAVIGVCLLLLYGAQPKKCPANRLDRVDHFYGPALQDNGAQQ